MVEDITTPDSPDTSGETGTKVNQTGESPPTPPTGDYPKDPLVEEKAPMPTIGRIVHYSLSEHDAREINRRRTNPQSIAERISTERWSVGAQAHIGNEVKEGDIVPLVVTRSDGTWVNGQCLLDGSDQFWVTSRFAAEGNLATPGCFHWPVRQ